MTTIRHRLRELSREHAVRLDALTTVTSISVLTPTFTRITVASADLAAGYTPVMPADGIKLVLPTETGDVIRSYTTRAFDREAGELTIDLLVHGPGVVAAWLAGLHPGDTVRLLAARRDFAVGEGVDHHLVIADACALPAAATILERLPEDAPVTALLHAPNEPDRDLIHLRPGDEGRWTIGRAPRAGDNPFLSMLESLPQRPGRTQAWIAAEAGAVAGLRRAVLAAGIAARDDLHAVAYWKEGISSEERDRRINEQFTQAIGEGINIDDPHVRTRIEQIADDAS